MGKGNTGASSEKPTVITEIEKILKRSLYPAPRRGNDPIGGLMPYKENMPKYAIEGDKLIGLNLAKTKLTNDKWQQIVALPDFDPEKIRGLSLSENRLTEFRLPPRMTNLERLYIDENPLIFPDEAIIKQGDEAVLRFLKEILTQGERDVYEVKMLILGEGGTGKTTLWHKLQDPEYPVPQPLDKQPSTVGIEIKEGWTFEHLDHPGTPFLVNLWDFGGQPIQQMTHQFFLTRRSFYVLLADSRRDVANFSYWFKIIDLLGCDPKETEPLPVFVVLNKKGTQNPPLPYDPEDAQKSFPRLNLIDYEVDFAVKDYQLNKLPYAIQDILCHRLPHLPLKIPSLWDEVREELYRLRRTKTQPEGKDHITRNEFQEICENHGIKEVQQMRDLSQLLHDLGVILHHQDDARLQNFIVLNPEWALNAVYEILKHDEVRQNQGRFDEQFLIEVWNNAGYGPAEQFHLMGLMLKDSFEVCFQAEENGRKIYIAPQLLPEYRPKFNWNSDKEALRYTFQYPFMPNGLIGRLIVRLNENLKAEQGKKIIWIKGMLLEQHNCEALVIETKDERTGGKIIQIEVKGDNAEDRRFLLRTIRMELDKIHHRSFPSLRYFEKIPCCCQECQTSGTPEFYDLNDLKRRKAKGRDYVECRQSYEEVAVETLMSGVYGQERPRGIHPVKQLIAEGKLKLALSSLLESSPNKNQNEVINLQARLSTLDAQIMRGELTPETIRIERNNIVSAALALCDEID